MNVAVLRLLLLGLLLCHIAKAKGLRNGLSAEQPYNSNEPFMILCRKP